MLSRRSFLLGTGAAVTLAACGGDDDAASPTTTAAPSGGASTTAAAGAPILGVTFDRNALLVTGIPQRAPFVLFEETGGFIPLDQAPDELVFELETEAGEALSPVTVERHGDDVERPYWPLVTTFAAPGVHIARVRVDDAALEYRFNVNDPAAVAVPQVGQPLPGAPTPTTADPLGVQTICTQDPPCPFHEVSLADALAQGRPIALLVSTPAFCQVAICGPVLDLLTEAAPGRADIDFVHLEVYPDGAPPQALPTPIVSDPLGLTYEPALFVANGAGVLTSRLDNIYDGPELAAALDSAIA